MAPGSDHGSKPERGPHERSLLGYAWTVFAHPERFWVARKEPSLAGSDGRPTVPVMVPGSGGIAGEVLVDFA